LTFGRLWLLSSHSVQRCLTHKLADTL